MRMMPANSRAYWGRSIRRWPAVMVMAPMIDGMSTGFWLIHPKGDPPPSKLSFHRVTMHRKRKVNDATGTSRHAINASNR